MKAARDSFIGDRQRPLSALDVAERRQILGTGKPPAEFYALRSSRSIFIVGEETERPRIAVDAVKGDSDHGRPGGWRVEIVLNESQQIDVQPRTRLRRDSSDFYREGHDRMAG